jgi:hypothetical protein
MAATLPNNRVVGTDWLGPVTQAKCEWEITLTAERVTIYYRDVWALWRSRVPALAAALGFGPSATFTSCTARQIDPGVLCEVQLIFTVTSGTPTPASTMSENATTVRESITKHSNFTATSGSGTPTDTNSPWQQWWNPGTKAFDPNYTTMIPFAPVPLPDYLTGLTEFDVGASTITVTDYFTSEPSDVEPTLGKIATPPGKSSGLYLLISGGKNLAGQFWVRKLVYQFSALTWPTQVYPT